MISDGSKRELGGRSGRATALAHRPIAGFSGISKSSYEYWGRRLSEGSPGRDTDIREVVRSAFEEKRGALGYRTVWAHLCRRGVVASEKRVCRVLRGRGLEVVYDSWRRRDWSSYAGEISKAPPNLVCRRFRAAAPGELWLTDITELGLPSGDKAYLSIVLGCFDGMPVSWSVASSPSADLANSSLCRVAARGRPGARTVVRSDRGCRYRWPERVGVCDEEGLVRSMPAKGRSPDNAACEGFFGRPENEFFHCRDWMSVCSWGGSRTTSHTIGTAGSRGPWAG